MALTLNKAIQPNPKRRAARREKREIKFAARAASRENRQTKVNSKPRMMRRDTRNTSARSVLMRAEQQGGVNKREPNIVRNGQSVRIRHRERFATFGGDLVSSEFESLTIPINPINPEMFPWLNTVAPNYETYKFTELRVLFETDTNVTENGSLTMAIDFSPTDEFRSATIPALENLACSNSCTIYKDMEIVATSRMINNRKVYFVTGSPLSEGLASEVCGNLYVRKPQAVGSGRFYVVYDIELRLPQPDVAPLAASLNYKVGTDGARPKAVGLGLDSWPLPLFAPALNPSFALVNHARINSHQTLTDQSTAQMRVLWFRKNTAVQTQSIANSVPPPGFTQYNMNPSASFVGAYSSSVSLLVGLDNATDRKLVYPSGSGILLKRGPVSEFTTRGFFTSAFASRPTDVEPRSLQEPLLEITMPGVYEVKFNLLYAMSSSPRVDVTSNGAAYYPWSFQSPFESTDTLPPLLTKQGLRRLMAICASPTIAVIGDEGTVVISGSNNTSTKFEDVVSLTEVDSDGFLLDATTVAIMPPDCIYQSLNLPNTLHFSLRNVYPTCDTRGQLYTQSGSASQADRYGLTGTDSWPIRVDCTWRIKVNRPTTIAIRATSQIAMTRHFDINPLETPGIQVLGAADRVLAVLDSFNIDVTREGQRNPLQAIPTTQPLDAETFKTLPGSTSFTVKTTHDYGVTIPILDDQQSVMVALGTSPPPPEDSEGSEPESLPDSEAPVASVVPKRKRVSGKTPIPDL